MPKKLRIILILILNLIAWAFPVRLRYKDGGTVEYRALLYGVTRMHRMTEKDLTLVNELVSKLNLHRDEMSEEEIEETEHLLEENQGFEIGTVVRILFFEVYDDTHFVSYREMRQTGQ